MSRRTTVALISPFPLTVRGGVTRYVHDLSHSLRAAGTDVTVYEGKSTGPTSRFSLIGNLVWAMTVLARILFQKPDVVHAHTHWAAAIPGFLLKTMRVKHAHVFTFHTHPEATPTTLQRLLLKVVLSKCDCITFVSASLAKVYDRTLELPSKKVVVHPCYRSIDVTPADELELRKKFDIPGNSVLISFIGPLVWKGKVRGVRLLIGSFASVAEKHPDASLLVVGDGPLRSTLENHARELHCDRKVVFTGMTDNPGVALSMSDIYAHISYQEGMPHSLLDAMAASKPIIASRVGGIPEAISDGVDGLLVENKMEEIVEALERLIANEDLRVRLGEKARGSAEENFGCGKAAQALSEIYQEVA